MEASELKTWLKDVGKDRFWLADETGISKRTWDNWCASNEFPKYAERLVSYMKRENGTMQLTLDEWKTVTKASDALGLEVDDFIKMVLTEKAEELLKRDNDSE